ncbi:hypothetical protein EU527_14925 [Candidatus Thorarchaeota archaeon]|nr:MAG: hypothetical protein EU527_14925 [Candidatus Thorarchaeota archaeon]
MEIPILTRFINGLKLFFESKRLRWLFAIFIFGAIFTLLFREIGRVFQDFAQGFIAVIGGIFPTYFLVVGLISLIGLQRFVASEESYSRSFIYTIVWMMISIIVYVMLWFTGLVYFLMIGIAFLGWIGFQAYLSSRSALSYAEKVDIKTRGKAIGLVFGSLHILSYIIVIGAFIVLIIWNVSAGLSLDPPTFILALLGGLLAIGFNFLNGLIMVRERKKVTVDNLAVLGLFVSLYVAYFLYNILKPAAAGIDLVSLLIDIGISVFFILYAMSNVGLTLASRANLDTRWKLSGELAANITFFLASGYLVVQALFDVISGGLIGERISDVIKLFVFPFVALIMELVFLRRAHKVLEPMPIMEEPSTEPEGVEGETEEEDTEVIEDISDEEEDYSEPEESIEDTSDDENTSSEDENESWEQ